MLNNSQTLRKPSVHIYIYIHIPFDSFNQCFEPSSSSFSRSSVKHSCLIDHTMTLNFLPVDCTALSLTYRTTRLSFVAKLFVSGRMKRPVLIGRGNILDLSSGRASCSASRPKRCRKAGVVRGHARDLSPRTSYQRAAHFERGSCALSFPVFL